MVNESKLVRVTLPSLLDGEPILVDVNDVHERLLRLRVKRVKSSVEFEKWAKSTLGENYEKTICRTS